MNEHRHMAQRDFELIDSGLLPEEHRRNLCAHLAECPACMERYIAYLEGDVMLKPPRAMAAQVVELAQKRQQARRATPRYRIALRALLAASLAITLWWGGAFSGLVKLGDGIGNVASQVHGQVTQGYSDAQRSKIDREMESYLAQMDRYFEKEGATVNE